MSTALELCASAYRMANLDQTLNSFSVTQEYPYNCALDIINTVLSEMNRLGSYWFTKTATSLAYTAGDYSYDLSNLSIDPPKIIRVRRMLAGSQGDLTQMEYAGFERYYRYSAIQTAKPTTYSKFNDTLELNTIPDQDYQLTIYHYKDMPLIVATADTLLVPIADEDVVRDGILAHLLGRMGMPEYTSAYQLFMAKVAKLLAEQKKDTGLQRQMPASF